MKSYTFRRQNYFIFRVEADSNTPSVHFLWGKFDFRAVLAQVEETEAAQASRQSFRDRNGQYFRMQSLQNLYRSEWFEFVRPTAHGLQLEETMWSLGDKVHYAEYPQDLRDIACSICAAELSFTWLQPTVQL